MTSRYTPKRGDTVEMITADSVGYDEYTILEVLTMRDGGHFFVPLAFKVRDYEGRESFIPWHAILRWREVENDD